jgi:hypothetical protein
MPSQSDASFQANATDVGHLLDVHELLGGTDPGRRDASLQVLNRAGVVLVCAIWEAYLEDLAAAGGETMPEADVADSLRAQLEMFAERIAVSDENAIDELTAELDRLRAEIERHKRPRQS